MLGSGENNGREMMILVPGELRIWGEEGKAEVLQREFQAIGTEYSENEGR